VGFPRRGPCHRRLSIGGSLFGRRRNGTSTTTAAATPLDREVGDQADRRAGDGEQRDQAGDQPPAQRPRHGTKILAITPLVNKLDWCSKLFDRSIQSARA